MNSFNSADFVRRLLAWYGQSAALLPWRGTRDIYRVWLSEILLQQTQIETVIPYYERFLARYPDVFALASAPLDDILKLWEGLGYYSRARHLHKTAQRIVQQAGGNWPKTAAELQTLPGIGPYTAGAIASIVYQEPVPVVDGNVIRVLSRILDIEEDITRPDVKTRLWQIAADWVPSENPGDYNQALMELGQKICRPRSPHCEACPVASLCLARSRGTQSARPVKTKKAPSPHYDVAAGIIWRDDQLLIAQRPTEGLLGGLWEFPGGKREDGETLQMCLRRELREELAIEVEVGDLFIKVKHAFTHFKITLYAYECRYIGPIAPYSEPQNVGVKGWAWARLTELDAYAFGKADRSVIAALKERGQQLL